MKHRFRAFALVALCLIGSSAKADIHIGTAGPLTGQYADFGKQIVRGAQAAVDDLNALGGIDGEQLVLDVADDACEPRKAVESAQSLIAQGVVFVAGHFCSFTSIPAAPVYAAAGVVMISPSATHPKLTDEGGWNVHRVCSRDDSQGTFAGELLARKYRFTKIALLDDGSVYGAGLTGNARKALAKATVKEALNATFKTGEKAFAPLVARMKEAQIGAVYLGGFHPEAALLVKEMRRQGLTAPVIAGDALLTDEFWTIAGPAAEGTIVTFPPDPLKLKSAVTVIDKMKADDVTADGYTLFAYAAVQAWAQAVKATGSKDGKRIAEWLRSGSILRTVIGDVSLDVNGDTKSVKYDWYVWSAGKFALDPTLNNAP